MSALHEGIARLRGESDRMEIGAVLEAAGDLIAGHMDELKNVNASYRLLVTDQKKEYSFALKDGTFSRLSPDDAADVTLSGCEKELRGLLNGKSNPVTALLFGKVRISGNKGVLSHLAAFI